MSDYGFEQPGGSGDWFKPKEHIGELILFTKVKSSRKRFDELRKEELPVVVVDYVVLDGTKAKPVGMLRRDVNVGDKWVALRLSEKVGQTKVLGRIGQTKPKQAGWQGAVVLERFTDDDAQLAGAWLKAHPEALAEEFVDASGGTDDPAPF